MYTTSAEKAIRYEIEAREKAVRDYNWFMNNAKRKGLEEGRQEGRQENSIEVAERMLRDEKLSQEDIAKYTGLSIEEVKELEAKILVSAK